MKLKTKVNNKMLLPKITVVFNFLTSINGIKEFNIFGVLDGHGPEGHLISQYVAKYIELEFQSHPKLEKIKNFEKMYEQLKENIQKVMIKQLSYGIIIMVMRF